MREGTGTKWISAGVALSLALAFAPAPGSAKGAADDELWTTIEKATDAAMNDDSGAFDALLTDDVTAFDVDPEGKPVAISSKAEAIAFFDASSAVAKQMGATMQVAIGEHHCTAAGELGYCTATAEFSMKGSDGTELSQPSNLTFVLRRTSSGWKIAHWHSSLTSPPAP